jgi:hypothetical protein
MDKNKFEADMIKSRELCNSILTLISDTVSNSKEEYSTAAIVGAVSIASMQIASSMGMNKTNYLRAIVRTADKHFEMEENQDEAE